MKSKISKRVWPRSRGLSSDAPPNTPKSLYVISTDDNGRDFKAPPKPYGVFRSAEGPGLVNNIAIELWPKFGSVKSRDSEENNDGKLTKLGKCYDGFACLNYGQTALSIKGLMEVALVLRGIEMDDRFMGAIDVLEMCFPGRERWDRWIHFMTSSDPRGEGDMIVIGECT
eukprot:scaffold3366_cov129-Skeletonema_dohrnii-CCMP3373.AAC.3